MGFSFSVGGVITFARDYDGVVRYIPMDRIVLETDAPYITPVPHRGRRNEPAYIVETAKKLGEIKDMTYEETARITTQNARRIFDVT
jgi:TatD DNase family protein